MINISEKDRDLIEQAEASISVLMSYEDPSLVSTQYKSISAKAENKSTIIKAYVESSLIRLETPDIKTMEEIYGGPLPSSVSLNKMMLGALENNFPHLQDVLKEDLELVACFDERYGAIKNLLQDYDQPQTFHVLDTGTMDILYDTIHSISHYAYSTYGPAELDDAFIDAFDTKVNYTPISSKYSSEYNSKDLVQGYLELTELYNVDPKIVIIRAIDPQMTDDEIDNMMNNIDTNFPALRMSVGDEITNSEMKEMGLSIDGQEETLEK